LTDRNIRALQARLVRSLKAADRVSATAGVSGRFATAPNPSLPPLPTSTSSNSASAAADGPTSPNLLRARSGSVMTTPPKDGRDDYQQRPWFASINRLAAEVMLADKPRGAFVVRPASVQGCLSLTHVDLTTGLVGHGLIRLHNGPTLFGWAMEDDTNTFPTVQLLLESLPLKFDVFTPPSSAAAGAGAGAPTSAGSSARGTPSPLPATPLSPTSSRKPLPTVPGRQAIPAAFSSGNLSTRPDRASPVPVASVRTLPTRTVMSAQLSSSSSGGGVTEPHAPQKKAPIRVIAASQPMPADPASRRIAASLDAHLADTSALLDELADLENPTTELEKGVSSSSVLDLSNASPHRLLGVGSPPTRVGSSGALSPPRALSPTAVASQRALSPSASQRTLSPSASQRTLSPSASQRALSPTRALPTRPDEGPRRPAPSLSGAATPTNLSPRGLGSTRSESSRSVAGDAARKPSLGPSRPLPGVDGGAAATATASTATATTMFEREVAPVIDMAAVQAQLRQLQQTHAGELAQVDSEFQARAATADAQPFEANSELEAKLAQLLKAPGDAGLAPPAPPAIFVEYARLAQQHGALELMQEMAPLVEQLQRLTWSREFAEAQLAREEVLLQRDRRSFFAKRAQVCQTAVTGAGLARRVAVRSASVAGATRRLVDPTEQLKALLDEFDVRTAPLKLETNAVDLFRAPQAQVRRSVAELSFLALEIDSSANELLDSLQYVMKLMEELRV
jgi:hypothetical protein